jgi:intracellular septation protein
VSATELAAARSPDDRDLIVHVLVRRIAVETGPLIAFFLAFYVWNIFAATGAFMAATFVAVAASLMAERRVPVLPLLSLALVLGFGALTLLTDDPRFIMVRPTVVNAFYGTALLLSAFAGRPLLEAILSPGLRLDGAGWRRLTVHLGLFMLVQAALNEIAWRGFGVEPWVVFKTFGTIPLNLAFAAAQIPIVRTHRLSARSPESAAA